TSGLYRVDGPGLRTSKPFRLADSDGPYRVSTASGPLFAVGLTMLIVGGAALLNGLSFLLVAAVYANSPIVRVDQGYVVAGGILAGAGALLGVPGVILMKGNGRTTVTPAGAPRVAVWVEAPALREPTLAMATIPLWAGRF